VELPEKQGLKQSLARLIFKIARELQWNFQKNKD